MHFRLTVNTVKDPTSALLDPARDFGIGDGVDTTDRGIGDGVDSDDRPVGDTCRGIGDGVDTIDRPIGNGRRSRF